MNHPGFYSLVRFGPDIERGEVVNVGVIIGAPGLGMRVKMADRSEYVKRRFGAEAFDNTRLTLVKDGFAERLKEIEPKAEALAAFGAAEAGKLQISPPRPMVVKNLDGEVLALFSRLVEAPEIARRERPEVSVPILDEPFTADFAFLNGARNLVKSVGLSGREENALEEASDLGSKGLLLAKHPDPQGTKSKLVIVADTGGTAKLLRCDHTHPDVPDAYVRAKLFGMAEGSQDSWRKWSCSRRAGMLSWRLPKRRLSKEKSPPVTKISDLSNLFHALSAEDWRGARVAAEVIASAEERAGHHGAATRLRGALSSTGPRAEPEPGTVSVPTLVSMPDILSRLPLANLDEVKLSKTAHEALHEILKEHRHRSRLLAHDLRPRARLFFFGPPGCGKTLTARALGTSLGVPTFVVRFDALVGSYLGQTSIRLREVFRFAESQPSVVVIDEIDAVGRHRGRTTEVGEMDRVVISLMQQLELVQPATMVIAASNLAEHLDPALLRRFDFALEFPRPSQVQLSTFARHQATARALKLSKAALASVKKAATFAEVEKLVEEEHRRVLLRNVS